MPLYESRTYTLRVGMSNNDEMYDEIASRFTRATGRPYVVALRHWAVTASLCRASPVGRRPVCTGLASADAGRGASESEAPDFFPKIEVDRYPTP
jgi:hypothetical protein